MKAELLEVDDPRWSEALRRIRHDVYHLPGYVAHEAQGAGGRPVAFLATDGHRSLLLPLVLRPVPGTETSDAASPYGYPGPVSDAPLENLLFWRDAGRELSSALRDNGVVACFIRINPLLPVADSFIDPEHGTMVQHGYTVSINLDVDDRQAWARTRANHRRQVIRARRRGMVVETAGWDRLSDFVSAYYDTMRRVGADDHYFFDQSHFEGLRRHLGDHVHLVSVLLDDRYLGGGVFFECDGIVQYHLGATLRESLALHPTKLMFDEVRTWAKGRGNHHFHLGGGVGGEGNPLFHFKAGFSDLHPPFYTYRLVTHPQGYAELCRAAGTGLGAVGRRSSFFPAYRAPNALPEAVAAVPTSTPSVVGPSRVKASTPPQHILVTSSGRRVELVQLLQGLGMGKVFAADMSPTAPALYAADGGALLPPVRDPSYLDQLMELCARLDVNFVLPTIDDELPPLARATARLADRGISAMVPSQAAVAACLDKLATFEVLTKAGVATVPTALYHGPDRVRADGRAVVVKPRHGSASKGVRVVTDPVDLPFLALADDCVVQPFISGPEVTVDAVVRAGKVLALGARRRVAVRSGEINRGVTVAGEPFLGLAAALAGALGLAGAFNFQVFHDRGVPLVSDVNPRLGGGLPLTQHAGGRVLETMLGLVDQSRAPFIAMPGKWMLRFDSSVFRTDEQMLGAGALRTGEQPTSAVSG